MGESYSELEGRIQVLAKELVEARQQQAAAGASHDIIVKQHAGTIEVDTELGKFTEIRTVLPRSGASVGASVVRGT